MLEHGQHMAQRPRPELSMTMVGFNDYEIQLLGRWHSNSFKLYLDSLQAWLLSLLTASLSMAQPRACERVDMTKIQSLFANMDEIIDDKC